MRISPAFIALAAVLAAPVISTALSAAAGRDVSPEQRQALFEARKIWAKDNYKVRWLSSRASSLASMPQHPPMRYWRAVGR